MALRGKEETFVRRFTAGGNDGVPFNPRGYGDHSRRFAARGNEDPDLIYDSSPVFDEYEDDVWYAWATGGSYRCSFDEAVRLNENSLSLRIAGMFAKKIYVYVAVYYLVTGGDQNLPDDKLGLVVNGGVTLIGDEGLDSGSGPFGGGESQSVVAMGKKLVEGGDAMLTGDDTVAIGRDELVGCVKLLLESPIILPKIMEDLKVDSQKLGYSMHLNSQIGDNIGVAIHDNIIKGDNIGANYVDNIQSVVVASSDSKSHGELSNLLVLLKVSTHNVEKVEVVKDNVVQIDFYECKHATISRRPRAKSSMDFQDNGGPIILEDESTDINYVMCAKIWNKKQLFDPGGTYLKSKGPTHKVGLFRCVMLIITKMNRVVVPFDPDGFGS